MTTALQHVAISCFSELLGQELQFGTPTYDKLVANIVEALSAPSQRAARPPDIGWSPTHMHGKTGGLYRVIGTAIHTETSELMVVYQNERHDLFVRPKKMFDEVLPDGRLRFRPL